MFEVTVTRLEAIAAAQIIITSAIVAKETAKAVGTFGASSPLLALATTALAAAKAAMAVEVAAEIALGVNRAISVNATISVGGLEATSAGSNAKLIAAVAATA